MRAVLRFWLPLVISLAAAAFSGLQWFETHQQGSRSVQPLVDFDTESDPDSLPFGVAIENRGAGPAVIKSIAYFFDRQRISDLHELVVAARLNVDQMNKFEFDPDDTLGIGEKEWLLSRPKKYRGEKKEAEKFADFLDDHLGIEVRFCSLAGECWTKCSSEGQCVAPKR